tara:strand:- start:491 stop:1594 length:1104 start_codon:yes stop_codon:yes gene_type:complete
MSVGNDLQEMENVVTKGAAKADPMPKMADPGTQLGSVEDLGGPTPENYKPDDDSAKLKEPKIATVKDIVNKGAGKADPMPAGMKEEEEVEGEVVAEEEEETSNEVVAEEETTEEEVVEETVEDDTPSIEEDIEALIAGEELSEEFQEKARTIFEAAIKTKVAEMKEEVQKQYEVSLTEEVANLKSELTERVDSYLEYVAQEWLTENQLSVEHGLKTEMTESFLTGMKSLFEEHYVTIPEEKYDVLNSMVEKLDEMEDKLNEQINKNIALNKRLAESVADVILADVSEGLAVSQKDKLASLAENVEFDGEQSYREKLVTLREAYFSSNTGVQENKSETISEETETGHQVETSTMMESYLQTLNRVSKK